MMCGQLCSVSSHLPVSNRRGDRGAHKYARATDIAEVEHYMRMGTQGGRGSSGGETMEFSLSRGKRVAPKASGGKGVVPSRDQNALRSLCVTRREGVPLLSHRAEAAVHHFLWKDTHATKHALAITTRGCGGVRKF